MKKMLVMLLAVMATLTLSGCDFLEGENTDPNDFGQKLDDCMGYSDYIVVNGECVPLNDILSKEIHIYNETTRVNHVDSMELMEDFTADLTGSTGLAVVPREVYQASAAPLNMSAEEETDESENIIVKLTEEGFFEEVSFSDDAGLSVEVTSNPLALEVYGDYTVVIFEVNLGYDYDQRDFTQKVYDSLYSGGVYVIHNETGKMFATKDVEYQENSWIETEDHSRHINLTVELNQPVIEYYDEYQYDEQGKPVLDENGNHLFTTIEKPVLDENGEQLIFTEGPILTEIKEIPIVDYIEVLQLDDEGNPLLDDEGKEIYVIEEQAVLDEEGNPIFDLKEVPMTDDEGNLLYQQSFNVELFINEIVEVTITEYYANITNNPLSVLAQKFVDRIMSEYYNWNYWRVNDYHIDSYGFTATDNEIYYVDYKQTDDESKQDRMLMKISYDNDTNEILLEDYLNLSKAGFDQCEILFDPTTENVICNQWDQNIKVFTKTEGLKTIPDSKNLNPVTFPNGELFFHTYDETYVEELEYYTTSLYKILADGSLESHYIELGEKEQICYGICYQSINVNYLDQYGNTINEDNHFWVDLQFQDGESIIGDADLTATSIGEFDSERPTCEDTNGCWYNTYNEILDTEGNVILTLESSQIIYPGDVVPNYIERYQFDDTASLEYQKVHTENEKVCENEIGCTNSIGLVDYSLNQWGLWLWQNEIVSQGETLINNIEINETNSAIYEYEKTVSGNICEFETCDEYINVRIFDTNEELLANDYQYVEILQGETIPLHLDYYITDSTSVTMEDNICTTSSGCYSYHSTFDGYNFWINYEQGEEMYNTISFAVTDKHVVLFEQLERDVCTDVNGCHEENIQYQIINDDNVVLYDFTQSSHIEYGYTAPYLVTVNINDVTIHNQKEYSNEDQVCLDEVCYQQVEFWLENGQNDIHLGWGTLPQQNGETLVYRVTLQNTAHISSESKNVCTWIDGCDMYTDNYIIIDEFGNEYQNTNTDWYKQHLPVHFEQGEYIPTNNNFAATFTLSNIQYQKQRISSWEFMNNIHNVSYLGENLFLIENTNNDDQNNFILQYNDETNRYKVNYTNISSVNEITKFGDSFIAINNDETAIVEFTFNELKSTLDYLHFDITNLTEGYQINGVNDLIIDYDGTIYFKGIDNFVQNITGTILEDGTITLDTEVVEREIIRVRPIN